MGLNISTDPAFPRIRASYGLSGTGVAIIDPDISSEVTCSDPACSLPVVTLAGDLPEDLMSRLTSTLGGF